MVINTAKLKSDRPVILHCGYVVRLTTYLANRGEQPPGLPLLCKVGKRSPMKKAYTTAYLEYPLDSDWISINGESGNGNINKNHIFVVLNIKEWERYKNTRLRYNLNISHFEFAEENNNLTEDDSKFSGAPPMMSARETVLAQSLIREHYAEVAKPEKKQLKAFVQ